MAKERIIFQAMVSGTLLQRDAVTTTSETLEDGSLINRSVKAGKISPLLFFMEMGYPVYRLEPQLRMGNGLFDMVSEIIYPEVDLSYATSCRISQPQFKIGRDLEAFMLARFGNALRPAPHGKLLPIFVHCKGTLSQPDPVTGSLRNQAQVKVALDLVAAFVKQSNADPSRIVVITPYSANVHEIEQKLKNDPAYAALGGMPPPTTIDAFPGQTNDIAVVVMGTTGPTPGPGFTTNDRRLNMMLTRQRCGLVIVGDIFITGKLGGGPNDKAAGSNSAPVEKFLVIDANGNRQWKSGGGLKAVHDVFFRTHRWVSIDEAGNDDWLLWRRRGYFE